MWGSIRQLASSYPQKDKDLIRRAFRMAERCHKGQRRMSGEPYISHPVAVAREILKLRLDAPTVAAGLLHDVLEDSSITRDEIEKEMGSDVAFLVDSLTKLDRIKYRGTERKVESTRKMFLAIAEDIRVVLIKLADRLHNMRTLRALKPEKRKRIALETLELFAPLAYRLGMGELKGELEDIAFPIAYPEEYKWLADELEHRLPERKKYLERISPIVTERLKENGIKIISINSRVKHYYSLWKKLLRHNLDLDRIHDILALRIIVPSIEECYRTLGIVHSLWRPLPGTIKDYISFPKANGYRSLHTTVFCVGNKVTEIQIRTPRIHEEAEVGIAAHWLYEESGKPKTGVKLEEQQIQWTKKLKEWQKEFSERTGDDFVEALKIDFFKDRIFVLTPKGEVVDLPDGATPIDFAYHVHSDIGNSMAGAKVNGKLVAFSHVLTSGDTVEIITGKNNKPKPDWLNMVRSSLARGHIRSALRRSGINIAAKQKEKAHQRRAVITISFKDRVGLLKDVTTVISKEKINIIKIEDNEGDFFTVHINPKKSSDLDRLRTRLRRVRGVIEVELKA